MFSNRHLEGVPACLSVESSPKVSQEDNGVAHAIRQEGVVLIRQDGETQSTILNQQRGTATSIKEQSLIFLFFKVLTIPQTLENLEEDATQTCNCGVTFSL